MAREKREEGLVLKERGECETAPPRKYRVIILNDDFTPLEFVVGLVAKVFRKTWDEAARVAFQVHHTGLAVAGVYTYEIAETKTLLAVGMASKEGHPLQLEFEPAE